MAQATVLAAGTTEATSTDIVVAAGEAVTVGIFATGTLPTDVQAVVKQVTPSGTHKVAYLTHADASTVVAGPGTYRVTRPAYEGTAFGVFTES